MSALWAVTSYFNPLGWTSRLRNYRCFRRHLQIPLLTVEWHPEGRFQLGPQDADRLIQVRGGDLMWQKERLLNLGIGRLPAEARYVAWLDCEVLFPDPDWVQQTLHALQTFEVIQPFSRVWYQDPDQTRRLLQAPSIPPTGHQQGAGVQASAQLFQQQGRRALVEGDLRGHQNPDLAPGSSDLPRIPGLAWAARREPLEEIGLFDRAIIGSGDWLWMLGILGAARDWLANTRNLGYGYLEDSSYLPWADQAFRQFGGRIGVVDTAVLHLYHGPMANRLYKSRHKAFQKLGLDIERDIVSNTDGVWQLVARRPEVLDFFQSYFQNRNEDEGSLPEDKTAPSVQTSPPAESVPRTHTARPALPTQSAQPTPSKQSPPDEKALRDLMAGFQVLPALLVAHQIGLFPLLAHQPRTAREIEQALSLRPRVAEALLATAQAAGLLDCTEGRFGLLPLARHFFLPESPTSFGGYWDLMIRNWPLYTFDSLRQAILTDAPQTSRLEDAADPSSSLRQQSVTRAMHCRGAASAQVWPGLVDLSEHRVFLDLGGGSAVHSIAAIRRWPSLQAIVLDRPEVLPIAREQIEREGLQERIRTQTGDFLLETPLPAADLHFYGEVFHNRGPRQCRQLVHKSFQQLPAGGLLLIHEMLFAADHAGPLAVAAASLNMLLWTREGRQYDAAQLTGWCAEAGFTEIWIQPAGGYFSLLQARKPGSLSSPGQPR